MAGREPHHKDGSPACPQAMEGASHSTPACVPCPTRVRLQCPDALGLTCSVSGSCKVWFERRGTHRAPGAEIPQPLQLQGEYLALGGLRVLLTFSHLPAPAGARCCDLHEQEIICRGSQLTSQAGSQTAVSWVACSSPNHPSYPWSTRTLQYPLESSSVFSWADAPSRRASFFIPTSTGSIFGHCLSH